MACFPRAPLRGQCAAQYPPRPPIPRHRSRPDQICAQGLPPSTPLAGRIPSRRFKVPRPQIDQRWRLLARERFD
eukprot:2323861-Pyramimonas_sp.AAC.1